MADQLAKGEEFERKGEKKLAGWGLFGSKYEDAAELFDRAANSYKLAKSWDKAGSVYTKIANIHLKLDSKHEAASSNVDAANCYKKVSSQVSQHLDKSNSGNHEERFLRDLREMTNHDDNWYSFQPFKLVGQKFAVTEAAQCLNQAVDLFLVIGRLNMAAKYCKELGEIYETEQNCEKAIDYYERAADLFQSEESTTSANQCKQKVAELAAQLEQYPRAVEIYEAIARHCLNNNLLKYSVKGYLLNAGLCQLCRGDVVAITNALERYQELDPTFSGTREYKFLADLAASVDEEDVGKFTAVVTEFDSMTRLDAWKTTLLLRAKNALKVKEEAEDDLT